MALAKLGHRFNAKVSPELADHDYCSTKKLYYYGVRVHVIGRVQAGTELLSKLVFRESIKQPSDLMLLPRHHR